MLDLIFERVYLLLHEADIPMRCILHSFLLCLLQVVVDDLLMCLHFFDNLMHILKEVDLQRLYFLLNEHRHLLHISFVDLDNRFFLLDLLLFYLQPIQLTNFDQYKFYSLQHKCHMPITLTL